jgi:hypothetical protein
MYLSLSKSLPSLGHFNQKSLQPGINGCACGLQTPHSVSLAIFCNRHLSFPNYRMKRCPEEIELGWTTAVHLGSASKRSAA